MGELGGPTGGPGTNSGSCDCAAAALGAVRASTVQHCVFRLKGADNAAIRHAMLEHGPHYIVKTVLNGETWLRCTYQNPLTEDSDIEALLDRLEELAELLVS